MAGQTVEQHPLRELVVEDEVDRGARVPLLVGRGQLDDRPQRVLDPVDEEALLLGQGVRRTLAQANDAPPPFRRFHPTLAGDDERAEQVDAVEQVVVLGIDVDPDQVGVLRGIAVGQRAVALARDVRQSIDGVLLPTPVAAGAVDQLVEALPDGPGGGQAASERRLPGSRHQLGPLLDDAVDRDLPFPAQILERGQIPGGGDPIALQRALVLLGQVRQERQVVRLGAPLHAELVVEAAVALVGQVEGDGRERLVDHAARRGTLAGDEVPHRAAVGLGIGHQLQESVLHTQEIPGSRALQLPALAVTRRRRTARRRSVRGRGCRVIDLVDGDPGTRPGARRPSPRRRRPGGGARPWPPSSS